MKRRLIAGIVAAALLFTSAGPVYAVYAKEISPECRKEDFDASDLVGNTESIGWTDVWTEDDAVLLTEDLFAEAYVQDDETAMWTGAAGEVEAGEAADDEVAETGEGEMEKAEGEAAEGAVAEDETEEQGT